MGRWVCAGSVGETGVSVGIFLYLKDLPVPVVENAELVIFASLPLPLDVRLFRSKPSDACLYPQGSPQDPARNGGSPVKS